MMNTNITLKRALNTLLLISGLWLCASNAPADDEAPLQRGIIRQVNLPQGWVVIDTRRLLITARTRIHNLAIGSNSTSALQTGRPVQFSANREHELLTIRIYPIDPEQRARLGDTSVETLQ